MRVSVPRINHHHEWTSRSPPQWGSHPEVWETTRGLVGLVDGGSREGLVYFSFMFERGTSMGLNKTIEILFEIYLAYYAFA